jgi:translation initiation factor 1A
MTVLDLAAYYRKRGKPDNQEEHIRAPMPKKAKREIFGIADQLLGASKIKVMCADGQSRMGRIPGKLKKRMWIREGDLLIVRPWEFQDDKADVVYRYTRTQASYLSRRGAIPESINVF